GDGALALLVRERQDLVGEWQTRDKALIAARSETPDKRNAASETALSARLAAIDARIGEIDATLKDKFPDYAAFASSEPIDIAYVQAMLGADEALVLLLDTPEWLRTPEETFIWVVTKTELRWVRSDLGSQALKREVAVLRCGLDYDGAWGAVDSPCPALLNTNYTEFDHRSGKPLPFDFGRAHAVYDSLFGTVENVIKDKHLLIIPSGALMQIPFQVLITEKPDPTIGAAENFRRAAWLIRTHALTVLPSVSSLKALRQLAKASHATRTLIGFGNPLLDGPHAGFAKWASEARTKQSCPETFERRVAALTVERRGVLPLKVRSGLVDVAEIRSQVPLPETADELCAVARALAVNGNEIRLGERATETEIKRLSAAGELSKYRLIHFATHGALAGQIGVTS